MRTPWRTRRCTSSKSPATALQIHRAILRWLALLLPEKPMRDRGLGARAIVRAQGAHGVNLVAGEFRGAA